MDKRFLRNIEVSPIGMGCMAFSHGYGQIPSEEYAVEAIRKAYDYGCNFFDTAESYGEQLYYRGHNEQILGKAVLATKIHFIYIVKRNYIFKQSLSTVFSGF